MTRARFYKPSLILLMALLLFSASFSQRQLNRDRATLGLTRLAPLENAPPILAFTTVALGGFRGLIANVLWIRATDLQDNDKYFEMVQLADWITKLQPHIPTVWYHQAWNMAYNISIKFNDPRDRWQWVLRGIELLRDQALKYNPQETILYRELAWLFQHKIGNNLDDAHFYFKEAWAKEMTAVLGGGRPNYEELFNPQTAEAKARVQLLREKYKMDPRYMKDVDDYCGPLEWRLPETHAIYWGWMGMKKGKPEDQTTVRRVIFQDLQMAFHRGRLIEIKPFNRFEIAPNLDMIPNANRAYEDAIAQDAEMRDNFKTAHRNFLKDAVYFLYTYNRQTEAARWFKYLREKYPNAIAPELTLDDYAIAQVTEQVGDTSNDKTKAVLEGYWQTAYYNLAIGEDDRFMALDRLAQRVWTRFQEKTSDVSAQKRVGLPPMELLKRDVLERMLDSQTGLPPQLADQLRTRLNMPAGTNAPVQPPPANGIK